MTALSFADPVQGLQSATTGGEILSPYLTRKEAALYLNISVKTLASHVHDGPKVHRFFGAVRYALADLDHWARQQKG